MDNTVKPSKPTFDDWFPTDDYHGDKLSSELEWNLTSDLNFELPPIPWEQFEIPDELLNALKRSPKEFTEEDLTERKVNGKGLFDGLMKACSVHILEEYEAGRITGAEYTKAYISAMQLAMTNAVQFLSYRDIIYWQSINAQLQAIQAVIAIITAKIQLMAQRINAYLTRVTYANNKLNLASGFVNNNKLVEEYNVARAQTLDDRHDGKDIKGMIGLQRELTQEQIKRAKEDNEILRAQSFEDRSDNTPYKGNIAMQRKLTSEQIKQAEENNEILRAQSFETRSDGTPFKGNIALQRQASQEQISKTMEEVEATRAQTLDDRRDGEKVVGTIGKQKDLYTQQIESFKHNSMIQSAKIYADSFSVQKTSDDTLVPPNEFTSEQINTVMNNLKSNVGLK